MELIFSADVVRHGDRTPVYNFPKISQAWPKEEMGELTPKGTKDIINLGKTFGKHYINDHSLLLNSFQNKAVYVRSSDFERTRQTARLILQGMYPAEYENIPINVTPKQEDLLLLGFLYAAGKEMKSLLRSKYHYTSTLSPKHLKEINIELKRLNDKFGTNLDDSSDIVKVADIVEISAIHNKPLLKALDQKELQNIIKLKNIIFMDIFKSHKVACLGAKRLINQMLTYMEDVLNNPNPIKYVLFSGHDTNILCLMSLLDSPLTSAPPYLSNVRFELFKDKADKLFVRLSYIYKTVDILGYEYCPYDKFVSFANNRLAQKCNE